MRLGQKVTALLPVVAALVVLASGPLLAQSAVCARTNFTLDCCTTAAQGNGTSGDCDGEPVTTPVNWGAHPGDTPLNIGQITWGTDFDAAGPDNIALSGSPLELNLLYCADAEFTVLFEADATEIASFTLPANDGGSGCGGNAPNPAQIVQVQDATLGAPPASTGSASMRIPASGVSDGFIRLTSSLQARFTVTDTGAGVLPVELTGFATTPVPAGVEVTWTTASEQDNLGFAIFRGVQGAGAPFTRLNQELVAGQGTSAEPHEYRFVDRTAKVGVEYVYYVESYGLDGSPEQASDWSLVTLND